MFKTNVFAQKPEDAHVDTIKGVNAFFTSIFLIFGICKRIFTVKQTWKMESTRHDQLTSGYQSLITVAHNLNNMNNFINVLFY